MKVLFVTLDGLGDRPAPQFGGRTPLETAHTPNLDHLATLGINGLLTAVGRGIPAGTPVAHAILLGYRYEELPGRAVFHAVARGIDPRYDEVVSLTRLAAVDPGPGGLRILERRMAAPEDQSRALYDSIRSFSHDGIGLDLLYTGETEGILRIRGKHISDHITDCDPLGKDLPVIKAQPTDSAPDPEAAARTADAVNSYLRWAYAQLSDHPVNRQRADRGDLPMNFLLAKWAGQRRKLSTFEERTGFHAISVTSEEILLGVMPELGIETLNEELHDTERDLVNRLRTAERLFGEGYDFIHVHTKQPDAIAHMADPEKKKAAIEALDRGFSYLVERLLPDDDLLIAVTSDHATPSVVSGHLMPGQFHDQHAGEPVPLVLLGRNVLRDDVTAFSERAAARGSLGLVEGKEFLPMVLSLAERTNVIGWRPTPQDIMHRPSRVVPFEV